MSSLWGSLEWGTDDWAATPAHVVTLVAGGLTLWTGDIPNYGPISEQLRVVLLAETNLGSKGSGMLMVSGLPLGTF